MLELILAAVGGVALLWRDSHYWNNFKSETNYFGPVQLRAESWARGCGSCNMFLQFPPTSLSSPC